MSLLLLSVDVVGQTMSITPNAEYFMTSVKVTACTLFSFGVVVGIVDVSLSVSLNLNMVMESRFGF